MADKTATFSVKLENNISASAEAGTYSLEQLTTAMRTSEDRVKELVAAQKTLVGSSEEVKAARKTLRDEINAEKNVIGAASLQLVKMGISSKKLADNEKESALAAKQAADAAKKLADEQAKEAKEALKAAEAERRHKQDLIDVAGSLKNTDGALGSLGNALDSVSSKEGLVSTAMAAASGAIGITIGLVVGLTTALVAGAVAFTKWVVTGSDAARTMALEREAWLGSAKQAENLWSQIDVLGKKVPQSTEKLQEMSVALLKARFSGQTFVDTLNASAQASAALGDEVGGKLTAILARGIRPGGKEGRIGITRQDLQDTRLTFDELAKGIARSTGKSIDAAKAEIRRGAIPLGEAAAGLRAAIEDKFGELNARKMLSLDNLKGSFDKAIQGLTKDVKIEPLEQAVKKVVHLFDDDTIFGAGLKKVVTIVGSDLVGAFVKAEPKIEDFFYNVGALALNTISTFYETKNAVNAMFKAFGAKDDVDVLGLAFDRASHFATDVAVGVELVVETVGRAATMVREAKEDFDAFGRAAGHAGDLVVRTFVDPITNGLTELKSFDWKGLGSSIIDGIVEGLSPDHLVESMKDLGDAGIKAFKNVLGIHSPSAAMRDQAKNVPRGAAEGVRDTMPEYESAIEDLGISSLQSGPRGAAAGGGAPIVINLHLHAEGASVESVAAISDESFLAKVTQAVEGALVGAGIPIMTGVPS